MSKTATIEAAINFGAMNGKRVCITTAHAGMAGQYAGTLDYLPGENPGHGTVTIFDTKETPLTPTCFTGAYTVEKRRNDLGELVDFKMPALKRKDGREIGSPGFAPLFTGKQHMVISCELAGN